ncbi:hypothetical protein [Mycolicibacterium pulveris]|uniref:hypothetical protein n=1 Tax=Mycolicibacterium pulveris TaxID=36813 RepID=UPI003CF8E8C8
MFALVAIGETVGFSPISLAGSVDSVPEFGVIAFRRGGMKAIGMAAAVAFFVAASVAGAGPANAALLEGTYAAKVTGGVEQPAAFPVNDWKFTSCGPDCLVREVNPPSGKGIVELRRQGDVWVGTAQNITTSINDATLVANSGPMVFELTKVG